MSISLLYNMQASLRLIPAEFAISRHHFKNKEEKKGFCKADEITNHDLGIETVEIFSGF